MNELKEWFVIYYDDRAEAIDTDLVYTQEPDVLMEVFLDLESNPEAVKAAIHIAKKEGGPGIPFAVINKVVS